MYLNRHRTPSATILNGKGFVPLVGMLPIARWCGKMVTRAESTGATMRDKLFTLTRSQREDLWRRYKQSSDRRTAERLHAILLLDEGRSAQGVSAILHLHPKTLKRYVRIFARSGVEALCTFNYG